MTPAVSPPHATPLVNPSTPATPVSSPAVVMPPAAVLTLAKQQAPEVQPILRGFAKSEAIKVNTVALGRAAPASLGPAQGPPARRALPQAASPVLPTPPFHVNGMSSALFGPQQQGQGENQHVGQLEPGKAANMKPRININAAAGFTVQVCYSNKSV